MCVNNKNKGTTMRSIFFTLCFFTLTLVQAQTALNLPYGGTQKIVCITPTADNGFILLVQHDNTLASTTAQVLVKTDGGFSVQWAKSINIGLQVSHENSRITQLMNGDYLLFYLHGAFARFDAMGNCLWNTSYLPLTADFYSDNSVCIEKPDGKFVALYCKYTYMNVIQFSATGVVEWSKKIDNTTLDGEWGIGKTPGFDIMVLDDGSVFISGKTGSYNNFVRLDAAGNLILNKILDFDGAYSRAWGIEKMEDGNILVAGMRNDKAFLMAVSPVDASILWHKLVDDQWFEDVIYIGNGNYAMAGKDQYAGNDLYLEIFNSSGDPVNAKRFSGIMDKNYTHPKFVKVNDRYYVSSVNNPGATGILTLMEFDSLLSMSCADTLTLNVTDFTMPAILMDTLMCVDAGIIATNDVLATSDEVLTINKTNFCGFVDTTNTTNTGELSTNAVYNSAEELTLATGENAFAVSMKVFPNPVKGSEICTIQMPVEGVYTFMLTDMMGKKIISGNFNSTIYQLNVQNISCGMHILKCVNGNGKVAVQKICIE